MNVRQRSLAAVALAALACAAACGKDNGSEQQPGPDGGSGAYKLALLGQPALQLHPGDTRTLQVVLAQDQAGPVSNATVAFTLNADPADPAGSTLSVASAVTNAQGVASVNLTAGAQFTTAGGFKVVARAAGYSDALPVAFSVSVVKVNRSLEIVATPNVKVQSTGTEASVSMFIAGSATLKVKERDRLTGGAISGDAITFQVLGGSGVLSKFSTGTGATALTSASGEAQVYLLSTSTPESFTVTGSSGSGPGVTFTVTVSASTVGTGCGSSQDCAPGQICGGGVCTTGGNNGCGSGSDNPCPFGWTCTSGQCTPPAPAHCSPTDPSTCPMDDYCKCTNPADTSTCSCQPICPVCTTGTTCDPTTHTCTPNGATVPDVSGVWYTKHIFDIQGALPTALQDVFKALRYIDQALSSALGLPGWLQSILDGLIAQYIPPWVQTVVRLGDTLGTVLSNLRSEGAMRLVDLQGGVDRTHVSGTEVWQSLVFYWLPLCCPDAYGGNCPGIAGDPDAPLDCARFDIATTDADNPGDTGECKGQAIPAITVKALAFGGTITGSGANHDKDPWTLNVNAREVDLSMGKVVLVLIDTVLALTTPWHCIDEATDCANGNTCVVDCQSLANTIGQATGGILDPGIIEPLCEQGVAVLGKTLTTALAAIRFDVDTLNFSGHCSIGGVDTDNTTCDSGTRCGNQLGQDDFDQKTRDDARNNTNNRDGNWMGSFFKAISGMPGGWEGKRSQFP